MGFRQIVRQSCNTAKFARLRCKSGEQFDVIVSDPTFSGSSNEKGFFKQLDYIPQQKFQEKHFWKLMSIGCGIGIGGIFNSAFFGAIAVPGLLQLAKEEKVLNKAMNVIGYHFFDHKNLYEVFNVAIANQLSTHPKTKMLIAIETLCLRDFLLKRSNFGYFYELSFFDIKSGSQGDLLVEIDFKDSSNFAIKSIEISVHFPQKWRGLLEDPSHTLNVL